MGKIVSYFKDNVISGTGMMMFGNVISAVNETIYAGITISNSIESRAKLTLLMYLGLGKVYAGLREKSQKFFNVYEKGIPEWKKFTHDAIYGFCFSYPFLFGTYLTSGASLDKSATAALTGAALAVFFDPVCCYIMDNFKDLCSYEESKRKWPDLHGLKEKTKKTLAVACVAASLTAITGVYTAKHYFFKDTCIKQMLEERSSPSQLENIAEGVR